MAESTQRLSDYEKSQARYQELLSGSSRFKDMVEKQIGEKTNYNKDLIDQQQRLIEKQLSLPYELRQEFSSGPQLNPLRQEEIIRRRQAGVGQSLGSVGNLLSARKQDQADILNTALQSYQTRMSGEQTAAENAWRLYQDALAREAEARRRADQLAQETALENYFNNLNNTEETAGGIVEVETPDAPELTPREKQSDRIIQTAEAMQNAGGFWDRFKSYYKNAGWNALNPFFPVAVGTYQLGTKNKRRGSSW